MREVFSTGRSGHKVKNLHDHYGYIRRKRSGHKLQGEILRYLLDAPGELNDLLL